MPAPKDPQALFLSLPPTGEGSIEPTGSPPAVQEMAIPPTPVNEGATTSVIQTDVAKSSEDVNVSLPLSSSEPQVVDQQVGSNNKQTALYSQQAEAAGQLTAPQEQRENSKSIKQSVPYTKRSLSHTLSVVSPDLVVGSVGPLGPALVHPLKYNPIEAKKLQTFYRLSKKRAACKVLNDNKPSYSGTVDDAN